MSKRKIDLKREWFEREQEEEEEVQYVKKLSISELEELVHLNNCKRSTDCGIVDQGFPKFYASLAAKGWLVKVDNGYRITTEGRAYVNLHREALRTA